MVTMEKLNLGAGEFIMEGFINVDISAREGVDVVHNLDTFPYPFKDNEFDYIIMRHVIEHLNNTVEAMGEIYRICKKDGMVKISFPYHSHPNAWVDPTHKKCLTEETMRYFSKENPSKS